MLRVTLMKKEAKITREDPRRGFRKIPSRGETRFPGIVEDAKTLGISRTHLFLVLNGERTSARLLARYQHLKGQQQQGGAR